MCLTYFFRERFKGCASCALGGLVATDDVLESSCHHKILLLQTQLFPFEELQHKMEKRDLYVQLFCQLMVHFLSNKQHNGKNVLWETFTRFTI